MDFCCRLTNELPFLLEIPNGQYDISVNGTVVSLQINSDCYTLHTARFPENAGKGTYVAEKSDLINIIDRNRLGNYAFANCMTFVSCDFRKSIEITDDDINKVSDIDCIELIKTNMMSNSIPYANLDEEAKASFDNLDDGVSKSLRRQQLIEKHLYSLANDQIYYFALNRLIREYSYLRGHFWVYMINENVLNGTLEHFYLDGKLVDVITRAGFAPTILPSKKKYPELTCEERDALSLRLSADSVIPIEAELLLVAKNLWYRREYRSAVIESSAALEIVVARKIQDKMLSAGKNQTEVELELEKTKTNFTQRCDVFLKNHAGKSFKTDNNALWLKIDAHRNNYRHKIAHSDVKPNFTTTEAIIKDFEEAIAWVNSL